MKIGISDESVRFMAETSFEVVHILAASVVCKVPFEDNAAVFATDDLATLRLGCLTLFKDPHSGNTALGEQHYRNISKVLRDRKKKRIGYAMDN